MKIAFANILTALNPTGVIGTKVTEPEAFLAELETAVEAHDVSRDRAAGQHFVMLPKRVLPHVTAGVGPASSSPQDYVLREHRGRVEAFLRRELAVEVTGCAAIVYTLDAYTADPEVGEDEAAELRARGATHVLVAVLAFGGPDDSPLTPFRLVSNLAGGNREALAWSADEMRAKARKSLDYWTAWSVVADEEAP